MTVWRLVFLVSMVVLLGGAILPSPPIAVAQEATPVTGAVVRESLVETTVPAEALPTGGDRMFRSGRPPSIPISMSPSRPRWSPVARAHSSTTC